MTDLNTSTDVTAIPAAYQPAPQDFRNRIVLVTGATGGLGRAASLALSRAGASVILLGRSQAKLEQLYDEVAAAGGAQPAALPLNLMTATWGEYEALAQTLEAEFGRLDGILHAAAHFKAFTRLEDLEPREWLDALQINLTAPYALTRLCLPLLRKSADASVVFVSDSGARTPKPFHAAYGASKAAAETMALSWAAELQRESREGSHLRFNTWYPGPLRTGLRAKGYAGESLATIPEPASAVPALLWLLGPASRGISGRAF